MEYSEFSKNVDYKIKIEGKKYFFRDAVKLYYKNFNQSSIDYNRSVKIIEEFLKIIKQSNLLLDTKNKIVVDNSIILQFFKKQIFLQNTILTNRILKYFKKKGIVSKKSKLINDIYEEYDANSLTDNFIHADLKIYDAILDYRDEVLKIIEETDDESERELYLYLYLKVFALKRYDDSLYKNFNRTNLFNLSETIVLIYKNVQFDYTKIDITYFDEKLNSVLKNVFFNTSQNLLDKIDHYFENKIEFYEEFTSQMLKQFFFKIENEGRYLPSRFKKLIKEQIQFEYQLHNSPVHHLLQENNLYPKTSYLELVKLFPKQLKNNEYINIDKENIKKQKETHYMDEDEQLEIDIQDYISLEIAQYDELKEFRSFFKISSKQQYKTFKEKLDLFIDKHKDKFEFPEMLFFIRYLVQQSTFDDCGEKKLANSTVNSKINIIFYICFDVIIKEGKFDSTVVELIEANIERYTNNSTRQKYFLITNEFLENFNYRIGSSKGKNITYSRKSLIFKKDLDQLYDLYSTDFSNYNEDVFIQTHQKIVFCLLMYYSGTRESELWSREVSDIYIMDDQVFVDIHINDAISNLKTRSAKRRVEFTVDDLNYFELVKKYLSILEKKGIKYLFPEVTDNDTLYIKKIKPLKYFTDCNADIQKVTDRYASLHSFRHTYITNNLRKLIMKINSDSWKKSDLYNLINMAGHLGPEVTLRFYAHIDYILYFKGIALF